MVRVRVQIHQAGLTRLVSDPRSPVYRHMDRVGVAASGAAKGFVGVDTGRLRQSIGHQVIPQPPTKLVTRVSANTRYARVHHEGHGVIRPRRARMLAWRDRRTGRYVFAKRVRAVPGNPYLFKAVRAVLGRLPRRGRR